MSKERTFVRDYATGLYADLDEWLRIPSVSADPERAGDVRRSAEWLAGAFGRSGFPTVEIWETPGAPAVFAEWPGQDADAPAVLVYGHHDVQPADPEELWRTPPFEPTVRGEELFARGASDDKGQVLFHLLGLRAHLLATGRRAPAVTLRYLIEGEEESGSPNFAALLSQRADRLACDVVVVTDTGVFGRDTPSIVTGMRGLVECEIRLHGPDVDLHSGSFGGAVPNPLAAMCRLLAALHDSGGRVRLPGFYDQVRPLARAERDSFAALPFDQERWMTDTARSRGLAGEAGYTTLERLWARPTAEINGMWGGYLGPGGKTIVPTDAHAKLSFRLVADQDPDRVRDSVEKFVAGNVPDGLAARVTFTGAGVRPCLTSVDHPAVSAAVRALRRAFETDVLFTREGGSGPEAALADTLRAPLVFLGVGLPDDRIHSPNERVVLPMLLKGAEAAAYLWTELSTLSAQRS
ncbi:MAG TPA: dipeptidase [Mycobacteriales bacterium]|nr:dipeptidase [Mycobacteriales bacterium]